MFKQTAYNPIPVEVQTAIMWAMQNDFFDSIEVSQISSSVESLKEYLTTQGTKYAKKFIQAENLSLIQKISFAPHWKTGKELCVNPSFKYPWQILATYE